MTVSHHPESAPTGASLDDVAEPVAPSLDDAELELADDDEVEVVVELAVVVPELPQAARNSDNALTPATAVMVLRADVRDTRQPPGLMVPCEGPHNDVNLMYESACEAGWQAQIPD